VFLARDCIFVYSWVATPFLNKCSVNLNLPRSYKVGLRRMWYPYEFIAEIIWLAVRLGGCLKKLILSVTFPIFVLKLVWIFRYVVLNCLGSFFNVTATIFLLKLRALELLWRRSPLAPKLVIMISLLLVILLKTVVATQAILSNFCIEFWAPWCYVINFLRNFVCN
jgi:hypothetical protein